MTGNDSHSQQDSLVDRGLEDNLDEGCSPMDRQPASHRRTTVDEQRRGDTWEERLAQEEPDPTGDLGEGAWPDDMAQDARAGRLVAPDEGAHEDTEGEAVAQDVGLAGGAASAEEAAMHVFRPDEE